MIGFAGGEEGISVDLIDYRRNDEKGNILRGAAIALDQAGRSVGWDVPRRAAAGMGERGTFKDAIGRD